MTELRTVFIDMDGVLANFDKGIGQDPGSGYVIDHPKMFERGFFRNLEIMPGAKESIDILLTNPRLDLYILTKPTTKNLWCATEKYQWIEEHFPELLKKMYLACDKTKLLGDFLIDDDEKWRGFKGAFLHFKISQSQHCWRQITTLLMDYR